MPDEVLSRRVFRVGLPHFFRQLVEIVGHDGLPVEQEVHIAFQRFDLAADDGGGVIQLLRRDLPLRQR